jgi:predicted TIM-barrel enzyme
MGTTNVQPPTVTMAASVGAPERIRNQWVDALVSSDPGLNRLRYAAESALTIAVALAAEWVFVQVHCRSNPGAPPPREWHPR